MQASLKGTVPDRRREEPTKSSSTLLHFLLGVNKLLAHNQVPLLHVNAQGPKEAFTTQIIYEKHLL